MSTERKHSITVDVEGQKAMKVNIERLPDTNLVRMDFGLGRTRLVLDESEFRRIAKLFTEADQAFDKAQAKEKAGREAKAVTNSINAFRKEVARKFRDVKGDTGVVDALRNAERDTPVGIFVANAYHDLVDDEEERIERGIPFWEFHGGTAFDLLVNVMRNMNCPNRLDLQRSAAFRAVTALCGSNAWMGK